MPLQNSRPAHVPPLRLMAIARHQPLMAWPPNNAWKRTVAAPHTSAMMLQMLAQHSTHANSAIAMPHAASHASAARPCRPGDGRGAGRAEANAHAREELAARPAALL